MSQNFHQEDEHQAKRSMARDVAKKQIKKKALGGVKKLGKKIAVQGGKALLKGLLAVLKIILAAVAPYALVILAIFFIFFIIYFSTTMIFSFAGTGDLEGEAEELRTYIIEESNKSIDASKPEQKEYMFPYELVVAIMQIYQSEEREEDVKSAIKTIIKEMKPEFEYGEFDGYTETEVTYCDKDGCSKSTSKTPAIQTFLTRVDAWNGILTTEVKDYLTEWETSTVTGQDFYIDDEGNEVIYETSTTTRTRSQVYYTEETFSEDYTKFEKELMEEPFNYQTSDIVLTETLFQSTGGVSNYATLHLGAQGYDDLSSSYAYDGLNVIPGAGVPAQYMEFYLGASKKYGIEWYVLAAVHYTETKFSTYQPMISSVGAEGHLQLCDTFFYKY